ncbi:uncharacterized protein SETTUDRAFT_43457 [Exserohilum turcica Et28A]|uniref:Alpha/beta hydrolase fold-3 domain-containing protein n=1 Tax=Exserohilum turcicum (strain 28A) TaxID=671987 RepID=R0IAP2_EXST2|nr:uncharacterized protein SETTUDRAFT_43457 [Exserohilum turcica Et28A]EOA82500.1 hypothetical protein SETTUDRAFT_43457 [Exserohilum turcica Et28A]
MMAPGGNSTKGPTPISVLQRMTCRDPGVRGRIWVAKVRFGVPGGVGVLKGESGEREEEGEDDVRNTVFNAIQEMREPYDPYDDIHWDHKIGSHPLTAEWTGYRSAADANTPEPADVSEAQKYECLMQETTSKITTLYFHGGAMYLLDPATTRATTGRLARETGGRVFSVRYRLAPQNAFPAALLDAFTAYLTLLAPPAGSLHEAVAASEIVFAGDSAGGTCCTALLQLLLHLHRQAPAGQVPRVRFHGKNVSIPLPAGVALASPWLDITRGLPSIESAVAFDYLPAPSALATHEYPVEEGVWPAEPPRADLYCEAGALLHPLVSPLAAKSWTGSPPLFFSVGHEMLRDEDAVLAQRAVAQNVPVVWREFEAMPHCFAMLLEGIAETQVHWEEFASFCRHVVQDRDSVVTNETSNTHSNHKKDKR